MPTAVNFRRFYNFTQDLEIIRVNFLHRRRFDSIFTVESAKSDGKAARLEFSSVGPRFARPNGKKNSNHRVSPSDSVTIIGRFQFALVISIFQMNFSVTESFSSD